MKHQVYNASDNQWNFFTIKLFICWILWPYKYTFIRIKNIQFSGWQVLYFGYIGNSADNATRLQTLVGGYSAFCSDMKSGEAKPVAPAKRHLSRAGGVSRHTRSAQRPWWQRRLPSSTRRTWSSPSLCRRHSCPVSLRIAGLVDSQVLVVVKLVLILASARQLAHEPFSLQVQPPAVKFFSKLNKIFFWILWS